MAILFVFLSAYYSDFIIQRELDQRNVIMNEMKSEVQGKHQFVNLGVKQLYLEKHLIEDLSFALQHDYEEYNKYRLDKFSRSDSFVPYHFDIFVKNYFTRDLDIVALNIQNETLETNYLYLYNQRKWKKYNREDGTNLNNDEHFMVVKEQINNPVSLERIGEMSVYFSYDSIDRILNLREASIKGTYLISDSDMNILYLNGVLTDRMKSEISYKSTINKVKADQTYYIQSTIDPMSQLQFTSIVPRRELTQLLTYKRTILSIILLLSVVAIALPYFSLRGHSQRVNRIVDTMRKVQEGDLQARIQSDIKTEDDLSIISDTFNETLDELNNYVDKIFYSKLRQKEAELSNLRAQINPHFLYNTLEAIRMKSLSEGGGESATMIVQLGQLFRYSLDSGDQVTLEKELNHAIQYIELFKIRFPEQLTSELVIEDNLRKSVVPAFILQPIIENYLIYGFRRDASTNKVIVEIFEVDQGIEIKIKDNGLGIEKNQLHAIKDRLHRHIDSKNSIGLGNVNQRIQLKYGEKYGVQIESLYNESTIVTLLLPKVLEVDS